MCEEVILRDNMQESVPQTDVKTGLQAGGYNDQRRKLLQMGAAGLPMVLTLRASASEALVSQLQCLFTIKNNRRRVLVDSDGRAWVGNKFIKSTNDGLKTSHITRFIDNAKTYFTSGTVPVSYRPSSCGQQDDQCGDDDDDSGGHGWAASSYNQSLALGSDEYGAFSSDGLGRSRGGGDDDDDCEDDNSEWTDCGYAYYDMGKNHEIQPNKYLTSGGNWNLSGKDGLYLSLSITYADSVGNDGVWPGISCIVSILTYLDMNR